VVLIVNLPTAPFAFKEVMSNLRNFPPVAGVKFCRDVTDVRKVDPFPSMKRPERRFATKLTYRGIAQTLHMEI
jgi:hypothetical protein